MAVNKAREIARLVGTNNLVSLDSDLIHTSYNTKGSTGSSSGAMSVYSSIDLLPSTASVGTKALITSTNRLYIFTNGGWYNIAIINNFNPQWITQPDGSYILAIDGSTTTITVLATDSDDVPITYSAVTDSGFDAFATIAHDSDKDNVWTVTPTGTSGSYSGSVTFKASDGVNLVQAVSTFTLSFIVTNSNYTVLLLKADSDGTDNQIDASTNNHTITENGNVTSTAFTPYHPGGYSVEFNATDASITVPAATGSEYRLGPDTGWTLEFWVNSIDFSQNQTLYVQRNALVSKGTIIKISTSGLITFNQGDANTAGWEVQISCGTIAIGTWNHVAIVRNGSGSNNFTTYLNGTQQNQATWSGTSTNRQVTGYIGGGNSSYTSDNREFVGFLRDFRYSEEAVYTSSFTVPTEPLTVLSTTKLLYFNGETYIADKASVYGAPTITSNVSTVRDGPYDYLGYTKANHGGSVYFDGSGDYLSISDASDFSFGTGDFTWECWLNLKSYHATVSALFHLKNDTALSSSVLILEIGSSGQLQLSTGSALVTTGSASDINLNQWHHVAVSRSGTSLKIWLDGQQHASVTNSTSYSGSVLQIGAWRFGGYDYSITGYMSDVRIVKGTAVYTSAFTPPTAPLTAITNTQLLTCTNKNNFFDVSANAPVMTPGGSVAVNTSEVAYTGNSIYFSTRSDEISGNGTLAAFNTLPGDFTIELECKLTSSNMAYAFVFQLYPGSSSANAIIRFGDSGFGYHLQFVINNGGGTGAVYNVNLVQSDFTSGFRHIAWTRESGTNRVFIDGTQYNVATGANPSTFSSASWSDSTTISFAHSDGIRIGLSPYAPLGYLQNIRVTNGLARYTSNFTPPTAEFDG